eukprot:671639-Hanusia_phi.AAC.3
MTRGWRKGEQISSRGAREREREGGKGEEAKEQATAAAASIAAEGGGWIVERSLKGRVVPSRIDRVPVGSNKRGEVTDSEAEFESDHQAARRGQVGSPPGSDRIIESDGQGPGPGPTCWAVELQHGPITVALSRAGAQ